MEVDKETVMKPSKHNGSQICQICSDNIETVDDEPFVACDICRFPVCRPFYEYERKDGTQSCPQCKSRYKWHKGSPLIHGYEVEDGNVNDAATIEYASGDQDQKQKIADRMLSWRMTYERGDDVNAQNYDKEGPLNHIPLLTHGQPVSGEFSSASPDHLSMASPESGIGKRVHPLPYVHNTSQSRSREFGSPGFGNVAWKERVEGWKVKQDKNTTPMSTSHAPSEGREVVILMPARMC